jgi:hypothetical protein
MFRRAFGGMVLGIASAIDRASVAFGEETSRGLTEDERQVLRSVFERALDLDRVRVAIGGPVPLLGQKDERRGEPRAVGATIYWPAGGRYAHIPRVWPVFVHEATHVAQYQNGGPGYIADSLLRQTWSMLTTGSRRGPYDWISAAREGIAWAGLGAEQQAALVQDLFEAGLHRDPGPRFVVEGADFTDYVRSALAEAREGRGYCT